MRVHAKSFYFSTRLLPSAKRQAVEALYGLFRTADDLADEPGIPLERRHAEFDAMLDAIEHLRADGYTSGAPWFAAVHDTVHRYPIDLGDIRRLVIGCRSDLETPRIETLDDLYRYSAAVAGTVGRASMPILGGADDDSRERGERLGIAMQYTNIIRDVAEDRALGRNYLPHATFPDASEAQIMRELTAIARGYYREARVLAGRVPNDGSRAALLMTAEIYGGILDRVEALEFDPERGRAFVPRREKLIRAARCLFEAYTGFATIK
jgi:phytoene synthase